MIKHDEAYLELRAGIRKAEELLRSVELGLNTVLFDDANSKWHQERAKWLEEYGEKSPEQTTESRALGGEAPGKEGQAPTEPGR
jgi:hypothetical protein